MEKWIYVTDALPERTLHSYWMNDDGRREIMQKNDHAIVLAYDKERGVVMAKYDCRGNWSEVATFGISGSLKPVLWCKIKRLPKGFIHIPI